MSFQKIWKSGVRSIASVGLAFVLVAAGNVGVMDIAHLGKADASIVNGICGPVPGLKINTTYYCPVSGVGKVKSTVKTGNTRMRIVSKAGRLKSNAYTQILINLDTGKCTSQAHGGVTTLGGNFGLDLKTPFVNIIQAHASIDVSHAWTKDDSVETCNSTRTIFPCDVAPNTAMTQLVVEREWEEKIQMSGMYYKMIKKTVKKGNFTSTLWTRGAKVELNIGTPQIHWMHDYYGAICQNTSILGKYNIGGLLPNSFENRVRAR
jgi:hypothetical protein